MLTSTLLLILAITPDTEQLFSNPLKKIKEKAKQIYKSKFGKDKTSHFLGHDLTEYPGTKEKYLSINQAKWDEYYRCLKDQDANLGRYHSVTPEAVLGFDGNNVKLECKVCLSPKEREKISSVVWEWGPKFAERFERVEVRENVLISNEDQTLYLYDLKAEQSGQYLCRLGEALTAPYYLTVVNINEDKFNEVHPPYAPIKPRPRDAEKLEGYELILDTTWSEWSPCSTCDNVGKRHKTGYCTIFEYQENHEVELTVLSNQTQKIKEMDTISELDLQLFGVFKFGIPCDSHILPATVSELNQVKERKNEIMIGYCKEKCPKNEVFEVRDKEGNVIERANNSAGIYSLVQGLPPLEPPVERRLVYAVKGRTVIVNCPGNMNNDAPIQWQIANKYLIPEIISAESNGRIFISITDRVHIKNAKIADSNIYSCWQRNALAGTVRLVVEKKLELNFTKYLMIFGIIVIMGVYLKVFIRAFFGRKYARI